MAIEITKNNCVSETGMDWYDLLSLTGIFGVHTKLLHDQLINEGKMKQFNVRKDGDKIVVEYRTPEIKFLRVEIYLKSKKLKVDYFRVQNKENHVGFPRLIAQVEAARKFEYDEIELLAYVNPDHPDDWDGYYVWGKYGFLMFDQSEIEFFNDEMKKKGLDDKIKDIADLVSTPEGTEMWKEYKRSWWGKFNLKDNSRSMEVFSKYRVKRGL